MTGLPGDVGDAVVNPLLFEASIRKVQLLFTWVSGIDFIRRDPQSASIPCRRPL
jgi:hypothetical protein